LVGDRRKLIQHPLVIFIKLKNSNLGSYTKPEWEKAISHPTTDIHNGITLLKNTLHVIERRVNQDCTFQVSSDRDLASMIVTAKDKFDTIPDSVIEDFRRMGKQYCRQCMINRLYIFP